ncbi:MAG: hypothetical protein ACE5DO_07420 [Desulfobacterales bacterium]
MGRQLDSLTIPCGQGSINRTKNLANIPKSDLAMADGITVERDLFEKEHGASKVNSVTLAASTKVTGLHELIIGATQEQIAYLDNGSIVTVTSSGIGKTIKTGLTTGTFPRFTEGWDGAAKALYITNGKDTPQVYTQGASTSNIPGPAGDWSGTNQPTDFVSHKARMFGFGNGNFPHTLYLSDVGTHGDFTGGESALHIVYPGDGEKIVAAISWRERLYVFKYPRGIYIFDDTDISPSNWRVVKVTGSIGVAGPGCVLVTEDDILILASDGYIYALSQIRTLGQVEMPPLLPIQTGEFFKEELNLSNLDIVQSVYYGHKRKAMFAVPGTGSTVNNRRIDIDMHVSGRPMVFYSKRDTQPSIGLRRATLTAIPKPIIGDDNGFVYDIENTVRAKDGAGFNGQFETPGLALYRAGNRRGNLKELEITFQPQGAYDVDVEVHRDGVLSETVKFSQQSPGAAASSFSLDSDVIAGNTVANVRKRITGDARFVKLLARNNVLNETFRIMDMNLRYTGGSTKP